jgi:hypothetical protein
MKTKILTDDQIKRNELKELANDIASDQRFWGNHDKRIFIAGAKQAIHILTHAQLLTCNGLQLIRFVDKLYCEPREKV